MASIVQKQNRYYVVYRVIGEDGKKHQKWESYETRSQANRRKTVIEEMERNPQLSLPARPGEYTVRMLLEEYVEKYGVETWAPSTYTGKMRLLENYIDPIIGELTLDKLTPHVIDNYYHELLRCKAVRTKYHHPRTEYVTPHIVREVHKFLRKAFDQAVRWELMERNPALNASLPKEVSHKREMWEEETLFRAIGLCEDPILRLAMNMMFACTLRTGEMLGLTWDCVDITPESMQSHNAYVYVDKTLQRVNSDVMSRLGDRGIKYTFPSTLDSHRTRLILKEPKTRTSVRKIYLPTTIAEMLVERRRQIEEHKAMLGDEYTDYNLVFSFDDGRPMEGNYLEREFKRLIARYDLPDVVMYSIRHTSISYKLKIYGGDIKAVQGDSGHAQMQMIADVYSHVIDEDRKRNTQRFEEAMYGERGRDADNDIPEPVSEDEALVRSILRNPEAMAFLKTLAAKT